MDNKTSKRKKYVSTENIVSSVFEWPEKITEIDLSNQNIKQFDSKVRFPPVLKKLNLSNNSLTEVQTQILAIEKLVELNLSSNNIMFFDDTPNFCHTLEYLNLENNKLVGPPYWVWKEKPEKLKILNLNCNNKITVALNDRYLEELLEYEVPAVTLTMCDCNLTNFTDIIKTFTNLKQLDLGNTNYSKLIANYIEEIPFSGLEKCYDLRKISFVNVSLRNIKTNIDILKNLVELNLSQNAISSLPKEFCCLENLEICILSNNEIFYLPEELVNLKKLKNLCLDGNKLCMLPEHMDLLENLNILDLYDNCLYEVTEEVLLLSEIDLSLNYLEEPTSIDYLEKRKRLRVNKSPRRNERKQEEVNEKYSDNSDEEFSETFYSESSCRNSEENIAVADRASSTEDWDSDDYWVPYYVRSRTAPPQSPWMYFINKKMNNGNFCPIDCHTVPIAEQVKYERLQNPKVVYESEGQFDDFSGDDS